MGKRKQWRYKWRERWIKREGRKMKFFVWNNCTNTERCFCLCEGRWITSSSLDSFLLKTTWHVESGVFFWSFVSLRVSAFCLPPQYFPHVCMSVCSSRPSSPGLSEGRVHLSPQHHVVAEKTSSRSTRAPTNLGEVKPTRVTDHREDTPAGGCCGCSSKFCTERLMGVGVTIGTDGVGVGWGKPPSECAQ